MACEFPGLRGEFGLGRIALWRIKVGRLLLYQSRSHGRFELLALLVYVLLRDLAYLSKWAHSFTRLFTILRSVLWGKFNPFDLLGCYGTAKGSFRNLALPEQAYFPGFL